MNIQSFLLYRITAFASGLVALLVLVGLWLEDGNADDQQKKRGFNRGKVLLSHPFANKKSKSQPSSKNKASSEPRRISVTGGQKPAEDVPDPESGPGGISVGGGPAHGVVSDESVSPVKIDAISAIGGNEIVTDFNYPDADIVDIAKTVGKLTGKNFIFDKDVKGRITIVSNSPITVSDAWKAFLTSLDINGYTLLPSGSYIRIARKRDARDRQLNTYTGKNAPATDALVVRVIPLKHISADEVARTFRSFMPADSRIIPYSQTNTVIITDTGSNIKKLMKMVSILDVPGFDAGIEVIPVTYASATEIAKLLDELLPGQETSRRTKRRSSFKGRSFSARKTKEGGVINTVIADERTNSLIVHANSQGANQVRALVVTLDRKQPSRAGGGKIHVLYLQFAAAEELAKTLNNFSSQKSVGRGRSSRRSSNSGVGSNPLDSVLFEGQIKVSPDKATNSLVITASPADFVTVQRVINKLDIPRDEVYVEAAILEMTLDKNFDFSTGVAVPNKGLALTPNQDLVNFVVNPLAQAGLVLGFKGGATQTFTVNGQQVEVAKLQGLIRALQTNTKSDLLATPQILTLDNTEAVFETQERIPVKTTSVNQGVVTEGTTKENIGLTLKIKPQINKIANYVKLDIDATLEDISSRAPPPGVANLAFATVQRKAKTSVIVGNSDTVVLGGLLRDKQNVQVSKVPLLGDIPLLGWLFKAKSTSVSKTNLLIFITPHIIRHYEKVREILDAKLKQRDDFIRSNAGSDDPLRKYRDQMIRSLPDIRDITTFKSEKPSRLGLDQPEEEDEE